SDTTLAHRLSPPSVRARLLQARRHRRFRAAGRLAEPMRRRDFLVTPVAALSGAAARAQQAQRTLRAAFSSAETGFDPERLAVLREAGRLMTAYMRYLLHMS